MSPLGPQDRENVTKASVLLRIARALNLGRTQAVANFSAGARKGSVAISVKARGKASVDLELWAIEKDRAYFREVFGRELSAAAV